jgi:hypothetical protein
VDDLTVTMIAHLVVVGHVVMTTVRRVDRVAMTIVHHVVVLNVMMIACHVVRVAMMIAHLVVALNAMTTVRRVDDLTVKMIVHLVVVGRVHSTVRTTAQPHSVVLTK